MTGGVGAGTKLEELGFKRIIFFLGATAGVSEEGGAASEEGGGTSEEEGGGIEVGGTGREEEGGTTASCSQLSGRTGWGGTSGI